MNLIYFLVLGFIILDLIYSLILIYLDNKAKDDTIPDIAKDIYDKDEYEKMHKYSVEKNKLSTIGSILNSAVSLLLIILGGYLFIHRLTLFTDSVQLQSVLFMLILTFFMQVISLPLDYYYTFVLEEKYGFNKSTKKTFIIDKVKSFVLQALLFSILIFVLSYLLSRFPATFYFYAWIIIVGFILVVNTFLGKVLIKLFNKMSPLEDGEFKQRIIEFVKGVGFSVDDIYVIDASKRSTKSNAFASGLGKKKHIVFYDTLLESMTEDEIIAILAHELGHSKYRHVMSNVGMIILNISIYLGLSVFVLNNPIFCQSFGFETTHFVFSILIMMTLSSPIAILAGILGNYVSRKNEYQADSYACSLGYGTHLASGLKKLAANNYSNLTPHPWVVKLTYSHPTIVQRLESISRQVSKGDNV